MDTGIFVFGLEGAATNQPGASPGVSVDRLAICPERAKPHHALVPPFQGLIDVDIVIPGRRPGLICGCPFGAKSRNRRLQLPRF